jgi:transcriptional regulator with XRE-family HTH domain
MRQVLGIGECMAKRRPAKLSDQLRRAISESGQTRYKIAKATGINEAALSKFFHGERGLGLESIDRLAAHLRLRVLAEEKRSRKGR